VILVLRFIGVMNAAIWFGSAVFVLVAAPVFFSATVQATPLGKFWPGVMVQLVFERFFHLQCICVAVAIVHQLAEWVYLGRILHRWVVVLLGAFLILILAEGLILEPKLKSWNLVRHGLNEKYAVEKYNREDQIHAAELFRTWHRVSRGLSLVIVAGLGLFFWKVVHAGDNSRFGGPSKFRS
jgi:hypothetical protein